MTNRGTETRPAPRVVHIDGRDVTLIPERKPEAEWRTRPGGWELTLEDGRIAGWVYLERNLGWSGWAFLIHDPSVEARGRETDSSSRVVRRPLHETPWNEMTKEQKSLAIELGLVRVVAPPPPPPNPMWAIHEARQQARLKAMVEFDRNSANQAWFDDNAMLFEQQSYAERREAAEHYARRTRLPRDGRRQR